MRLRRRIYHLINCRVMVEGRRFRRGKVRLHLCTCYFQDGMERVTGAFRALVTALTHPERILQRRRHLVVCLSTLQLEDIRTAYPTAVLIDRCIINGVPCLDGAILRVVL